MAAAVSVRHAVLSLHKREQWYEDIRPSLGGSDFNPLAASGKNMVGTNETAVRIVVQTANNNGQKAGSRQRQYARTGTQQLTGVHNPNPVRCAGNVHLGIYGMLRIHLLVSTRYEGRKETSIQSRCT